MKILFVFLLIKITTCFLIVKNETRFIFYYMEDFEMINEAMNYKRNRLVIREKEFIFEGFNHLSDGATINFLYNKVFTINVGRMNFTPKRFYVSLSRERRVQSDFIPQIIRDLGYNEEIYFIYNDGCYYPIDRPIINEFN